MGRQSRRDLFGGEGSVAFEQQTGEPAAVCTFMDEVVEPRSSAVRG